MLPRCLLVLHSGRRGRARLRELNLSLEDQRGHLQRSLAELDKGRELQEKKTRALLSVMEDLHAERNRLAAEVEERRRAELP